MRSRSLLFGALALAAVATTPTRARADVGNINAVCQYSATLGLGGFLTGCLAGTATRIGEDAFLNSSMFYFNGFPGTTNPSGGYQNTPNTPGIPLFDSNCGSGGAGTFTFCPGTGNPPNSNVFSNLLGTELVFGLQVSDPNGLGNNFLGATAPGYWDYTGPASRNSFPAPPGYQAVLMQVTVGGVKQVGDYVLAWEDLNSTCTSENPSVTTIESSNLTPSTANGIFLDGALHHCPDALTTNSDNDFNDFYVRLSITTGTPTDITPEPMTMSLMAFGLVGLGGSQLRRRRRNK